MCIVREEQLVEEAGEKAGRGLCTCNATVDDKYITDEGMYNGGSHKQGPIDDDLVCADGAALSLLH